MRYRGVTTIAILCMYVMPIGAQQQASVDQQPGLKWTTDQIREVGHHVRAGRDLTPESWPNGARVAVSISFDPDNFSSQLNRGDVNNIVGFSRGESAPNTGLPRVIKLLDKHNIPASWYIPAVSAMMHPEQIEMFKKRGDEVAIHGWIHENPLTIDDPEEEWRLISQALDLLEQQWGRRPVGSRQPSWIMSPYSVSLLEKAGMLYDSSLQAMDAPHEILVDGKPIEMIELPVNWILDDAAIFGATGTLPSPRIIMQTFKDDFDVAYREGTVFVLTLHPHLMPQRSRIKYLEELIVYMKSKPGVWFATAEDIALYIKSQMQTESEAAP